MLFPDYTETGLVYHIINLNDLKEVAAEGIRYDHKSSYDERYIDFHAFLNQFRTPKIPLWVDRTKAIFASLNYSDNHIFHSHSMLLAFRVDPAKCWVANENRANEVYEPFVLQNTDGFSQASQYFKSRGRYIITEYWQTSLSFSDNLAQRRDRLDGYDAEVLIFHDIRPEDIHCIAIVSDHRIMTVEQWKRTFCSP